MSIINLIQRVCQQSAIYWAPTGKDGYGGMVYADPIEVKVRWDDVVEVIMDRTGKEIVSSAQIISTEDMVEQGVLYLGELGDESDPLNLPNTYEIKKIAKTPLLAKTDKFVKLYYL